MKSEIRKFVNDFFFEDQFVGDFKDEKDYVDESVELFNDVLIEEFEIGFDELDEDLKESFINGIKEEWKMYKEDF